MSNMQGIPQSQSNPEFNKKNLTIYFVTAYLLFWVCFGLIGVTITFTDASPIVITIIQNISAWTPTFALLILFKRLMPDMSLKAFLRRELLTPLDGKNLGKILFVMLGLFLVVNLLAYVGTSRSIFNNEMTFSAIVILFFTTLTAGAMGEELGWRGYAYNEMRKRHGFLSTALRLGLIWGFWHTPLWFINGFAGMDLVYFIIAFLLGILAHSVIISFFYERTKTVWAPILIHFLYNFLSSLILFETSTLIYWWLPLIFIAGVLIVIQQRQQIQELDTN
jgi:membrane protease YdiL (CAAX protease family)